MINFPEGAENYYDVDAARELLERPDPPGKWWRCTLCGWPFLVQTIEQEKLIGATCCGGCGMTCMRPIEEY